MELDPAAPTAAIRRPRTFLLVVLGIVVVAFMWMKLGRSAGPTQPASNSPRSPSPGQQRPKDAVLDPAALDVHLEALASTRPEPARTERNPFRFTPKPPPPPPAVIARPPVTPEVNPEPSGPPQPPPPPPPPPITVKFIGVVDLRDGTKLAVFSECSTGRRTAQAREGGVVDGRYRLVKIGLESVVIEHIDGRGRTTLAKSGQECVGK